MFVTAMQKMFLFELFTVATYLIYLIKQTTVILIHIPVLLFLNALSQRWEKQQDVPQSDFRFYAKTIVRLRSLNHDPLCGTNVTF